MSELLAGEEIAKGLWMPTMLEIGDTVGIIEPNLYTGVGVVKVEDRGHIVRFCSEVGAAIVKYGDSQYGEVMIFLRDLLFYGRDKPATEYAIYEGGER